MQNGQPTVNYPSFELSRLIFSDGLKDKTYLSWEYVEDLWLVTIPTDECRKIVSERYTPKPTWNEVINYLCEKYQFIYKVSGGTNGPNDEHKSKLFFYEFTDKNNNVHFGRNNELHLVYEEMLTEFLKTLK